MFPVSGCDNNFLIVLQVLGAYDAEESELSTKIRSETRGDMQKLMTCVRH